MRIGKRRNSRVPKRKQFQPVLSRDCCFILWNRALDLGMQRIKWRHEHSKQCLFCVSSSHGYQFPDGDGVHPVEIRLLVHRSDNEFYSY